MNDHYKSFVDGYKRQQRDEPSLLWGILFVYGVILLIIGCIRAMLGFVPITHLTAIWTGIVMEALYISALYRRVK